MSFMFQFAAKSSDEDTTPPVTKRAKKPEQIGVETVASTDPGTTQNPQATSVALGVVDNPASIVVPTVGMIERVCLASQFIEPIFGHKGSTIRGLNEAKVEIDAQEVRHEKLAFKKSCIDVCFALKRQCALKGSVTRRVF
eukprot:m.163295 g.163295  ORF g.163295 m.163295 type:complete len:140 (-) comp14380_c0_seq22:1554-1973(-)